jgi:multiple sugar transport system permease protein
MNDRVSFFALIGRVSKTVLLLIYALFALFPLVWMIIMSLKPDSQMFTTTFIFSPTMENYGAVFLRSDYSHFFFNNLIVSISAVLLSLIVGVPAAYALARFQFKLKEDIAFTILSFRFAPEILVILPLFLIYQKTGLYDTYYGLIWVYQLDIAWLF